MSYLVLSAVLFTEIILRNRTRQGLLFQKYKRKLKMQLKRASRANTSEGEDHNFFQIVNSNPNSV